MKNKRHGSEGMVHKGGKRQKPPPRTAPAEPPRGQKTLALQNGETVKKATDKVVKLVQELSDDGDAFISAIELYDIDGVCWKSEIEEALKELRIAKGEEENGIPGKVQ